jgi:DNA-binding SARP family transcriptional activator
LVHCTAAYLDYAGKFLAGKEKTLLIKTIKIKALGDLTIHLERELISGFPSRKAEALLVYLAVEKDLSHRRENLLTLLWPGMPEKSARHNLSQVLYTLRKIFSDASLDEEKETQIPLFLSDRQTIQLNPEINLWIDVHNLNDLVDSVKSHDHNPLSECQSCIEKLEKAVNLYTGAFLADFYLDDSNEFEDWAEAVRESCHQVSMEASIALTETHLQNGDFENASKYAKRQIDLEPWNENAYQTIMRLLVRSGRHTEALRQYRLCVRHLEKELGISPSMETTAIYEAIRELRTQPISASKEHLGLPTSPLPLPIDNIPKVPPPLFVGRSTLLEHLNSELESALDGKGQAIFITGEAGSGKTSLLYKFAQDAISNRENLLVAGGTCNEFTGEGDPYSPFRETLTMLIGDFRKGWSVGRLTDEQVNGLWKYSLFVIQSLIENGSMLINTLLPGGEIVSRAKAAGLGGYPWYQSLEKLANTKSVTGIKQAAILDAYSRFIHVVTREHPLILILDDLQWADIGTVNLLFHLGRHLQEAKILLIGAYRSEEINIGRDGSQHPLTLVLTEFKAQFGDIVFDLSHVHENESREFVDAYLNTQPNRFDANFREAIYKRTKGQPLFTIELLKDMQTRGDLVKDSEGNWIIGPSLNWTRLPTRVDAVISARITRLGDVHRSLLEVASVAGNPFIAQVVGGIENLSPRELFQILNRICASKHRLVSELDDITINSSNFSRYKFNHPMFRQYLYQSISRGERQLLHKEVGNALESLYGEKSDLIAVELAQHFSEANLLEKSIPYLLKAGKQAQKSFAYEEAISHFQYVISKVEYSTTKELHQKWLIQAYLSLGIIYFDSGSLNKAENSLLNAIKISKEIQSTIEEILQIYHWLGDVYSWQNRWEERLHLGLESLELLGDEKSSIGAAFVNQLIAVAYWGIGNKEQFYAYTKQTAQFIKQLPYSTELTVAFIHIVMMFIERKEPEQAIEWLNALENRATNHNEPKFLGEAKDFRGGILEQMGKLQNAIGTYNQAQKIYNEIGYRGSEPGGCLRGLVSAFLSQGKINQANECALKYLEASQIVGNKHFIALSYSFLGRIALCSGELSEAKAHFSPALNIFREINEREGQALVNYYLGWANLAGKEFKESISHFQVALSHLSPQFLSGIHIEINHFWQNSFIGLVLSGLEFGTKSSETQNLETFTGILSPFRKNKNSSPDAKENFFSQWYAEQVDFQPHTHLPNLRENFRDVLGEEWIWEDSIGDCTYIIKNGLEISAVNGRDLWYNNLSSPRLIRSISQNFRVKTTCIASRDDRPAIGGLLLWKDKANYLCLDWGRRGSHEISFQGCQKNQDFIIGRGYLPNGGNEAIHLCIERNIKHVKAYFSPNGIEWFSVGYIHFLVDDPLRVGLHAIGEIPREIYRGEYPNGSAIKFKDFRIWELELSSN